MSMFKKHLFSTIGTRIVFITITFLQGIIIARFLFPEGRGLISVYIAMVTMILPLSEMGMRQASSFYLNKKRFPLSEMVNIQTITLILSILLTWTTLFFIFYSQHLINYFVISFIFLAIPFKIYLSYFTGIALANREIDIINTVQLISASTDFLFVIILFILLKVDVENYFISYFLSVFISSIYLYRWLKKHYNISFLFNLKKYFQQGLPIVKKGVAYALPLFVIGMNYSIDILVLNNYVDKSQIGIYSVGVTLSILLWQLPNILNFLIFSYSVSTENENQFSIKLWKKVKTIMMVLFPIAIIITFISKYFIPLIYGEEFNKSFDVLMYLMPGTYIMIVFKLLNGDLAARGFPMIAFYIFLFGIILNIILNIALIPLMGINGAAVASSISYTVSGIIFTYSYYNKIILRGDR